MKNKTTLAVLGLSLTAIIILILTKGKTIMEQGLQIVWDKKSEKKINSLHPAIRDKARQFINEADRQGIKLRLYMGLRTFDEQEKLYAKGRTAPGSIVTWAKPGESYHQYGLAFDVVEIKDGKALWTNPNWPKIGEIGRSFGFEWGGDWLGKADKPHFQMNFGQHHTELLAMYNDSQRTGEYINLA